MPVPINVVLYFVFKKYQHLFPRHPVSKYAHPFHGNSKEVLNTSSVDFIDLYNFIKHEGNEGNSDSSLIYSNG